MPRPFERLLVRSPNPLGDACMSVPAIRAIKRDHPETKITVFCRENLTPLWEAQVEVTSSVIGFPKGMTPKAVGRLVREKTGDDPFDAAVLLPNSVRSALEARSAGVKHLIGYRGHWRSFLMQDIVPAPKKKSTDTRHHIHRYLDIAKHLGANTDDLDDLLQLSSPPTPIPTQPAEIHIGVCPGAEYGNAKRYPVERYAAALEKLCKSRPEIAFRVSIFGSPAEREIGNDLASQLYGERENRAGKTSISDLVTELQSCHFLATNDTGTMHLAAALSVPVVAIFGSTDPDLSGPVGKRHRVIREKVDCSPCFKRECPIDYRCMLRIEPEVVAREMATLIDGGRGA